MSGITLIALVITIIVLLVFAGIVISMIAGDNGILTRAAEAKTRMEEAQEDEQVKLAMLNAASNINGATHIETVASLKTGNQKVKVPIPAGFALSPREGEQNVETGLVIIDSVGNEYVWIPVFNNKQVSWGANYSAVSSDDDWEKIEKALKDTNGYTKDYKSSGHADVWYGNEELGQYVYNQKDEDGNWKYYTNGNMDEETYENLYHNMLKSIYKNGGFYIRKI